MKRGARVYNACVNALIERHKKQAFNGATGKVWWLLRPVAVNNWRDLGNLLARRLSP